MSTTIQTKQFNRFINVVFILFTITIICCLLGLGVLLALTIGIWSVSNETIQSFLELGTVKIAIQLEGLNIQFNESIVHSSAISKSHLMNLILPLVGYLLLVTLLLWFIRNILKNISHGIFFSKQNSQLMEWSSYVILLLSLLVHTFHAIIIFHLAKIIQLEALFAETIWVDSVQYQFFNLNWTLLLSGIIIFIIARIFRHGAFLQEEYDATV